MERYSYAIPWVAGGVLRSAANRTPMALLLFICIFTLALALVQAVTKPLWFDEIWTARIAFLPTWSAVFHGTRTLDLNPPLEFFLMHLGRPLLGTHELGARFPSVLGFTMAVGSLFWLLRLYVSPWFAATGALLLATDGAVFYYASEARPYGLLLGFCALSLAAYNALLSSDRHPAVLRSVLFVGLSGMLTSHVFSVFSVGAILLAELIRTFRVRRIDGLTWAALLLPLCCCALYPALFASHGDLHTPLDMRPSLRAPIDTYAALLSPFARVLIAGALALLIFVRVPKNGSGNTFRDSFRFMPEQYVLFGILLAMPLIIVALLLATHPDAGYYTRYGLVCLFPIILLLTTWVSWRTGETVAAGRTLFLVTALLTLQSNVKHPGAIIGAVRHGIRNAPLPYSSAGGVESIYPDLPLVAGDLQKFMEADNRLPGSVLKRVYYLADTPTSLRLTHSDGYENLIGLREPFGIRGNVSLLPAFVAAHRDFLVIDDPASSGSWLLPWALEQHADVRYLGVQKFMGDELTLWRVTLP